jgi:hypothetical protein
MFSRFVSLLLIAALLGCPCWCKLGWCAGASCCAERAADTPSAGAPSAASPPSETCCPKCAETKQEADSRHQDSAPCNHAPPNSGCKCQCICGGALRGQTASAPALLDLAAQFAISPESPVAAPVEPTAFRTGQYERSPCGAHSGRELRCLIASLLC